MNDRNEKPWRGTIYAALGDALEHLGYKATDMGLSPELLAKTQGLEDPSFVGAGAFLLWQNTNNSNAPDIMQCVYLPKLPDGSPGQEVSRLFMPVTIPTEQHVGTGRSLHLNVEEQIAAVHEALATLRV